jgi:hypothetical protein
MNQTRYLQMVRTNQFERAYRRWKEKKVTQAEAAKGLEMSERTFRRYVVRYGKEGVGGLADKRLGRISPRRASREEVDGVVALYKERYSRRNIRHFYEAYTEEHRGNRSYTWVKKCLQGAGAVARGRRRGPRRELRERKEQEGMMIHQDASTHEWVSGEPWDLVVTMDDATGKIYSMFFVAQEGTWSSMRGVRRVLEDKGIFASFYSDRGSHYWNTPGAGGKVDKKNPTQFGRALRELGVVMIPGYSPEARGRSERMFKTLQGRLSAELAELGIEDMEEANRYLEESFIDDFNERFTVEAREDGSVFVPLLGLGLDDILCLKEHRVVGNDNCVRYKNLSLQIPPVKDRYHFVRANVVVHEYEDGRMAVVHEGRRKLGVYDVEGNLIKEAEAVRMAVAGV